MRKILLLAISIMPFNVLRIFLYRMLLGYRIDYRSYIGPFNYLDCRDCTIEAANIRTMNFIHAKTLIMKHGSTINRFNTIRFLHSCLLREDSIVHVKNRIIGLRPGDRFADLCVFELGRKSLLTVRHYVDLAEAVTIGDNVVFGGFGSQLWTHGFDLERNRIQSPIAIHSNIYIGSSVIITQGVEMVSNTTVGAGTVVSRSISESGFYVSNQLIKKSVFCADRDISNAADDTTPQIFRKPLKK